MSICGSFYRNVQAIVLRSVCLDNDSHFPDEAFSMAIHDAGMFTVKKTNHISLAEHKRQATVACVILLPRLLEDI